LQEKKKQWWWVGKKTGQHLMARGWHFEALQPTLGALQLFGQMVAYGA
jgi:hypothetical protein